MAALRKKRDYEAFKENAETYIALQMSLDKPKELQPVSQQPEPLTYEQYIS